MNATSDNSIPLDVRVALANRAIAYANALVEGDSITIGATERLLQHAAEDCRICRRAYELGMEV